MQALEFTTTITDGMIKVPPIKGLKAHTAVKVIVLFDEATVPVETESPQQDFQAVRIKTKGYVFNREEAHAR